MNALSVLIEINIEGMNALSVWEEYAYVRKI